MSIERLIDSWTKTSRILLLLFHSNLRFRLFFFQDECEFNVDFCGWSNVEETIGEDDFDWALSRGSLSTHTGPVRDQLSSNNYFNFGNNRTNQS